MIDLEQLTEKYLDKIIEHRRYIHSHPEVSLKEAGTAKYIAEALKDMGLTPNTNIGGNGVVAIIEGRRPGKCIGLRADFDALPMQEVTGLPYASQNDGVCHSCGHDSHAAMLLGCAYILNELRNEFDGTVKLVFQPAEESPLEGGAPDMIADGVLENPHVDAMIGQHVWPSLATGTVGLRNGAMFGASDRFFLTVKGRSAAGSSPEDGIDAIVIAANVINALQTIVSRNVSPMDSSVVTIGTISGGDRYNILANSVYMEGTCRSVTQETRDSMADRIEKVVKGVTEALGGEYEFQYCRGYSPTINDPAMFQMVYDTMKEQLGESARILDKAELGGEDFSYFCEKVPSVYYFLGCRPAEIPYAEFPPLHHGGFNMDERCIPIGTEMMVRTALRFLGAL